jgi:cytochrome P450
MHTDPIDPVAFAAHPDPHPVYRTLAREAPVHYVPGRDLWVLSRHQDILAAIKDPATFASSAGVVPSGYKPEMPTLIVLDPPDHTAMRKLVMRAFTPRRIEGLSDRIRQFAEELIEDIAAEVNAERNTAATTHGEEVVVDAFERFTDPLPLYVMAALLGVDTSERAMFKRCGDAIVYSAGAAPETLVAAQRELTDYLQTVFEERRRSPQEDLISLLLTSSPEGRALRDEELLGLCFLLLVAGTETTTSALGNALLLLQHFPESRARLVANPALLPGAVEEILRFDSPVQGLSRITTRPVEISGRKIPQGARVHLLYAAANRDPDVFSDPDTFDITRSPNPHLAFGFGIHFCLGASLARAEVRIGLERWLARWPDYQLDLERVERLPSDTNRGFARLPVRLASPPSRR